MSKIKIYLACGLTHVPRTEFAAYVFLIESVAQFLTNKLEAEVKYALRDSDPQLSHKPFEDRARLCYIWDKEMVEWADVVVAEASYPSTGLGIELQIACSCETPIVIAFKLEERHKAPPVQYKTPDQKIHNLQLGEGYVSLMALGLPSIFRVLSYSNADEACTEVAKAVATLLKSSQKIEP